MLQNIAFIGSVAVIAMILAVRLIFPDLDGVGGTPDRVGQNLWENGADESSELGNDRLSIRVCENNIRTVKVFDFARLIEKFLGKSFKRFIAGFVEKRASTRTSRSLLKTNWAIKRLDNCIMLCIEPLGRLWYHLRGLSVRLVSDLIRVTNSNQPIQVFLHQFFALGDSQGEGCELNSGNIVLNTIVRCIAHYNLFDNLQSSGDDLNTADTGNNSSSNASSKKKRGLTRDSKPLPNGKKKNIRECYDISHVSWFDLKEKIRDAWKRYKYRLNTTLIVGNNAGDVKAYPAPEFVPREYWVKFVDYCNSEKFMAKSKRNKKNRAKLIAPCTLSRTSMPITRHKLAELQNTMRKDPKSIRMGPNDVIAQKFGKERKGGTRGMGAGMSISLVEKVGHIVNENEELRSNNNELKFATKKLRKDLDALTKYVGNILVISPMDNLPSQQTTSSSQREQEKHQHIDKECRLVGCPWRIVAHGVIVGVDPTDMYHSVALGDDFYKVAIHDIVDGNPLLFRPNSNIKRLLDVGIGSFVAWPKSMITF
ncbi:hypothetical protein GIB67_026644 [Kingdonia uniflora]|uniref:DUF8039 domain-containing protein n=1 Tax=Kingdonia uniflora TaxID=39325 RepID=A0A7J7NI46_9MAGN|nr:hypothetical protein GIB67_026644 [Kingdonia uniflora]